MSNNYETASDSAIQLECKQNSTHYIVNQGII